MLFQVFLLALSVAGKECTSCNCNRWDSRNKLYSDCRPVTDERPCTRYCVKCEEDGRTSMPGGWTTHKKECEAYAMEETVSCDGLDCAGCLAVPDYGCSFADGACYTAGKEPMDATSYAFTAEECPKEADFQAITSGTCEDAGLDSIQSDDDCVRALKEFGIENTFEKQTSSSSMYNGCFTSSSSDKSYFVYDKPSSKYAMSDPTKTNVKQGTKPRKSASSAYTYYCYTEESAVAGRWDPTTSCTKHSDCKFGWACDNRNGQCHTGSWARNSETEVGKYLVYNYGGCTAAQMGAGCYVDDETWNCMCKLLNHEEESVAGCPPGYFATSNGDCLHAEEAVGRKSMKDYLADYRDYGNTEEGETAAEDAVAGFKTSRYCTRHSACNEYAQGSCDRDNRCHYGSWQRAESKVGLDQCRFIRNSAECNRSEYGCEWESWDSWCFPKYNQEKAVAGQSAEDYCWNNGGVWEGNSRGCNYGGGRGEVGVADPCWYTGDCETGGQLAAVMAPASPKNVVVYSFAAIGLGFLVYGAGKHFFTKNTYTSIETTEV